jgi:1,2-dihydroxy-3-keto-5-methylthiopentene dioxygenase
MALLQVMPDNDAKELLLRTRDTAAISAALEPYGVQLSHWELAIDPDRRMTNDEVLNAYSRQIEDVKNSGGYRVVDVAQLRPDESDPTWPERAEKARNAFLDEHRHAEDEVRFFAAGRGCFYLHLDAKVFAIVGEASDLLSVPANTPHWFDMSATPDFVAIRFFQNDDGWVGDFSGSKISSAFPSLDELVQETP